MAAKHHWVIDLKSDLMAMFTDFKLIYFWLARENVVESLMLRTELSIAYIHMWEVFKIKESTFIKKQIAQDVRETFDELQIHMVELDNVLLEKFHANIQRAKETGSLATARLLWVREMNTQNLPWWLD